MYVLITPVSVYLFPPGVAKSHKYRIYYTEWLEESNLLLTAAVSFHNSYYPSGDAFASGSDDATVSIQLFGAHIIIQNILKTLFKIPTLTFCYSAACMT